MPVQASMYQKRYSKRDHYRSTDEHYLLMSEDTKDHIKNEESDSKHDA